MLLLVSTRAHNLEAQWPHQKVNLIFDVGQLGSTILARLGNPFQEAPNDQIPMPGHITSYWRPTIVTFHKRLA